MAKLHKDLEKFITRHIKHHLFELTCKKVAVGYGMGEEMVSKVTASCMHVGVKQEIAQK